MSTESRKERKMRIWLPTIRTGSGTDVFVARLANALARAGHEPVVHWFDHSYELLPELLRFQPIPEDIDVIHANSWNASAFLGRGIPVVTTIHHLVHDPAYAPYRSKAQAFYHRWHVRWREERAVQQSAAVTAISNYVAQTVREAFDKQSVHVISNWVDTELYSPAREYSLPVGRPFRLLMVGNQSRRKGSDLLPAFAQALGADFHLRITGGLRGQDGGANSIKSIFSLGRLTEEELIHEYRYCDAVVSLSRYEGFGYSALEGMACGKPFLGFNTSGLSDVVTQGHTGFLVPINDLITLVQRCKKLSRDAALLQRMGLAGRDRAATVFAEQTSIESYLTIYRNAARGI